MYSIVLIVKAGLVLPLAVICIYSLIAFFCLKHLPFGLKLMAIIAFTSQIISNALVMLINPGIPSRAYYNCNKKAHDANNKDELNADVVICNECNLRIPTTTKVVHCEVCNVCILGKNDIIDSLINK